MHRSFRISVCLPLFDPLALDQACADVCLSATPLPHSQLADRMEEENFCDHHDHFENTTPNSEYKQDLSGTCREDRSWNKRV